MGARRQIRDEGEGDPVRVELPAGCVGYEPDAVAVDDEPGVDRLAFEAAELRQELLPEAVDVEPDAKRPGHGLRRDEGRERRHREHGRRVAKAHLPRAVEEARGDALGNPRLLDANGRGAWPQRHAELGGKRAKALPERCPVDQRSLSRLRDRDGGRVGIDREIGVLRLLAEPLVEPVRELRRADRAEPVGDVDALGGAEAGVAQEPLGRAGIESHVESGVEQRPGTEIASRHALDAARADQADRARHAALRHRQHRRGGLVARHPPDVDAGDRRPGRNRLALGQGDATENRGHDHENPSEGERDDTASGAVGRRACSFGGMDRTPG